MKLKTKILIGYGFTLALLILVCGWGITNLRRLGKASEAILQENYRSILAAENMIDAIERQDSAILLFLLANQQQGKEQFINNEIVFLQWLGRAKDNVTITGEEQKLDVLEKYYQDYLAAADQIQEQNINQVEDPSTSYYEVVFPKFNLVRQACIDLRELNQQTMVAASGEAQKVSNQAMWSVAIAGGAAAAVGLAFSLFLSRRLVQPLQAMSRATSQIASGNYDVEFQVKSRDELGILATEITSMSQKLKAFHDLNVGKVINEKQRSEAIVQSISDGIIVVDSELKVIAINPVATRVININFALAVGNHFLDVFNHQELYQYLKSAAQTGKSPSLEEPQNILSVERGKETLYYQFAITPVATEAGKVLGAILLLQDVTKFKEIDQLKSEFVATASHELRTPLTGMSMSLSLLLETAATKLSGRELELLKTADEDVERLRNLVKDLLDLSKIESGRIELEFAAVEVEFLLAKAVGALQVQADEKNITLQQQELSQLPKVKVDANKIIWILTNLLANALR